jgi:hypothetical protein
MEPGVLGVRLEAGSNLGDERIRPVAKALITDFDEAEIRQVSSFDMILNFFDEGRQTEFIALLSQAVDRNEPDCVDITERNGTIPEIRIRDRVRNWIGLWYTDILNYEVFKCWHLRSDLLRNTPQG